MKILIIDDSIMDRKILINTIQKTELEVEILQAANGEEGLKILSENYNDIKLILLDWQMPEMDGLEFMKGVVNINVPEISLIPVVMVTASGTDENKRTAYDVNPHLAGYLVKPFPPAKLIELITPILNG